MVSLPSGSAPLGRSSAVGFGGSPPPARDLSVSGGFAGRSVSAVLSSGLESKIPEVKQLAQQILNRFEKEQETFGEWKLNASKRVESFAAEKESEHSHWTNLALKIAVTIVTLGFIHFSSYFKEKDIYHETRAKELNQLSESLKGMHLGYQHEASPEKAQKFHYDLLTNSALRKMDSYTSGDETFEAPGHFSKDFFRGGVFIARGAEGKEISKGINEGNGDPSLLKKCIDFIEGERGSAVPDPGQYFFKNLSCFLSQAAGAELNINGINIFQKDNLALSSRGGDQRVEVDLRGDIVEIKLVSQYKLIKGSRDIGFLEGIQEFKIPKDVLLKSPGDIKKEDLEKVSYLEKLVDLTPPKP